ncbi:MAG: molybdenum ABC transporter ATP-binding protein [Pseudomonadota bacterium]
MLHVDIKLQRGDFTLQIAQQFAEHKVTAIFGPSGCGKSTLLRCIAGLETGLQGTVRWQEKLWHADTEQVKTERRGIALVFQQPHLFPTKSVASNVRYGMPKHAVSPCQMKFEEIIEILSLQPFLQRKPGQLSGGQKQRVAIARALLSQPKLLLLDEPMNGLDQQAKSEIMMDLRRIQQRFKLPVLFVSHHVDEVVQLADNVLLMNDGKLISNGPLQQQIGELSLSDEGPLSVLMIAPLKEASKNSLSAWHIGQQTLWLPSDASITSERRLLVWARDVSLSTGRIENTSLTNQVRVKILGFENAKHSAEQVVVLAIGEQELRALVTKASIERLNLKAGCNVYAAFKAAALH